MTEIKNINSYLVTETMSIRDVIMHMNKKKIKIAVCKNESQDIIEGVFTEGDFRGLIFKGYNIDDPILPFIKKKFKYVKKDYKISQVQKLFSNFKISFLPVIYKDKLIEILSRKDFMMKEKDKKINKINLPVIIMAGGKGTRMDPFTRFLPKALIPVGKEPIIEIIMNNFYRFGVCNFTLSLFNKSKMIKAYFHNNKLPYKIDYIEEKFSMGTIGSIKLVNKKINKPFFVINCDVLINVDYNEIINFHTENKHSMTLVASLQRATIPYGVCKIDKKGKLLEIKEKPSKDNLIITGLYLINPEVIQLIPKNKSFNMPDLITKIKKSKKSIGVYPISENSYNDIGHWDVYNKTISKLDNHII